MKPRKRDPKKSLDDVIVGGQAEGQEKKRRGRPAGPPKEKSIFYLELPVIKAIDDNCGGNKSFFVTEAVKEYLANRGIKIE